MRKGLCWPILSILPVAAGSGLYAQNPILETVQHSDWRYTKLESLYSINKQAIQDQLTSVGKQLAQLSVVNPPVYAELQHELHEFLKQLELYPPDYSQPTVYQIIRVKLIRLNDQIEAAFANERRASFESIHPVSIDYALLTGKEVHLWPYALLFRRPDYHAHIKYVVPAGEVVTILSVNRSYVRVRCRQYKGYVSPRMIRN